MFWIEVSLPKYVKIGVEWLIQKYVPDQLFGPDWIFGPT